MLHSGGDAVGEVPAARWVLPSTVDVGSLSEVQASAVSHGGFVRGAEGFDAAAFGVSPVEAAATDPQQRLLLEVGYAALHGGGARRALLLGGDGGVFVGIERPDWALLAAGRPASVYSVTGDTISVACGRLSFVLGLQGPCLSVDAACASALTALHVAWRAVGSGECGSAAAAAVSLAGAAPDARRADAVRRRALKTGRACQWVRVARAGCARRTRTRRARRARRPVRGPGGRGGAPGRAQREPDGAQRPAQRVLLGAALASASVDAARRGGPRRTARDGARRSDGGRLARGGAGRRRSDGGAGAARGEGERRPQRGPVGAGGAAAGGVARASGGGRQRAAAPAQPAGA